MALRNVLAKDAAILHKNCKKVNDFDDKLEELLNDMKETVKQSNGAGLAAPQVGILKRVFVVDVNGIYLECVNPEIISTKGEQYDNAPEGCLSVKNEWGYVRRPNIVTLKACDRYGYEFTITCEDYMARAICHENDHLNGILFTDIMEEKYIPKNNKENNKENKE